MADQIEFLFDMSDWEDYLAKCSGWIVELAHSEIYSEGTVFVKYKDGVSAFCGEHNAFPEPENAIKLIDKMSKIMVQRLRCSQPCNCKCQLVYVASLNEGDFERIQAKESQKLGIHFWLLPRYQHDEGFLKRINDDENDNDGFALIAEWRKQFLLRKKQNNGEISQSQKKLISLNGKNTLKAYA